MSFLETFNRSYERVVGRGIRLTSQSNDFFEDFYQRFTGASAEVALAFAHTDMEKQRSMLKKSLLFLVSFFAGHEPNPYLAQVARRPGSAAKVPTAEREAGSGSALPTGGERKLQPWACRQSHPVDVIRAAAVRGRGVPKLHEIRAVSRSAEAECRILRSRSELAREIDSLEVSNADQETYGRAESPGLARHDQAFSLAQFDPVEIQIVAARQYTVEGDR